MTQGDTVADQEELFDEGLAEGSGEVDGASEVFQISPPRAIHSFTFAKSQTYRKFTIITTRSLCPSPPFALHPYLTMPPKNKKAKLTYQSPTVEMGGDEVTVEIEAAAAPEGEETENENSLPFQEEAMEDTPPRVMYIDYLKSSVIGLLVGHGDEQALLTAHQALLVTSPWFADACAKFNDDVSVRTPYTPSSSCFYCYGSKDVRSR